MAYNIMSTQNIYLLQNIANPFCEYAIKTRKRDHTATLRTMLQDFYEIVIPDDLEPVILNKGYGKRALGFKVIQSGAEIYVSVFHKLTKQIVVEKLCHHTDTVQGGVTITDCQAKIAVVDWNDGVIPFEDRPVVATVKSVPAKMVVSVGEKIIKGDPETLKAEYIKNMSVLCAAHAQGNPNQFDFEDSMSDQYVVVGSTTVDAIETFKIETLEAWFDRTCA